MKLFHYLILLPLLGGCVAGDGEGLDQNGEPIRNIPGGEIPSDDKEPTPQDPPKDDTVTLTTLQDLVLSPICAQCHFGSNPPAGLRMDSLDASVSNLIGVAATLNPTFKRVEPGDAENSFLFLKIIGDPIAGNRMPLGQPALSTETVELFRKWIDEGAATSKSTPVVSSINLDKNSSGTKLTVNFSGPIERSTLSPQQVMMRVFDHEGTESPIFFALSGKERWATPTRYIVDIPDLPSPTGKLVLTLNDDALSTVMGLNGEVLDGDYDGINGGAFYHEINY